MKQPAVYILTNKRNDTLYTGVTSNLMERIYQHKNGIKSNFASKHGCGLLVYFALYDDMEQAILEEKRIKGGNRKRKIALIEFMNPQWQDLYETLF